MKKINILIFLSSFALLVQGCKHDEQIEFILKNQGTTAVDVYFSKKGNYKQQKCVLKPGTEFALYSLKVEHDQNDWDRTYTYTINSVVRSDSAESWKDLNVEGAWTVKEKNHVTQQLLIIDEEDF